MGILDSIRGLFAGVMGPGERYYHDKLGLEPHEDFECVAVGSLLLPTSHTEQLTDAMLRLLGSLERYAPGGAPDVQVVLGITTTRRFVARLFDDSQPALSLESGAGHRVEDTGERLGERPGPSGRLEPCHVLAVMREHEELLRVACVESQAGAFAGWS